MNNTTVYVDFGSSDTITLNLLLGGNTQRERTWNIEILTIPCNSVARGMLLSEETKGNSIIPLIKTIFHR